MAGTHPVIDPVLQVQGLKVRRGGRALLDGIDVRVSAGELVALMGSSGVGKTTFLRTVVALDTFDEGSIDVAGMRLEGGVVPHARTLRALRRRVGMVFQFHYLFEHLSACHNVWLAPVHVHQTPRKEAERRALELLDQLDVGSRANALPRELSGGEAQRVAIARALAMDPPLLLMDEPVASLDPARRDELGETLRGLCARGRTLLVTTHDDDFARDYATRVLILADGAIVEEGRPSEVLGSPRHEATRRLLQSKNRLTAR